MLETSELHKCLKHYKANGVEAPLDPNDEIAVILELAELKWAGLLLESNITQPRAEAILMDQAVRQICNGLVALRWTVMERDADQAERSEPFNSVEALVAHLNR